MDRLTENKIILVVRATRLADLKARFATKMQAKFYVSRLGGDFADYEQEDTAYQTAIDANQNLSEAHYRLAQAYKRIGEQSKAQDEFRLYEQIEKTEAAEIEQQRRELRQFLVVLKEQPAVH